MSKYLLSGVDDRTWSLLKACCAYNKITLKTFFHASINSAVCEFVRTDFYKDIIRIHKEKEDG